MLFIIALIQLVVFLFFTLVESKSSKKNYYDKPNDFNKYWSCILVFSIIWFQVIILLLVNLPEPLINLDVSLLNATFSYLLYSFLNYWIHRFKHSNKILWKYFHRLHHAPSQMETKVSFYRHPIEIIFNTLPILTLSWLLGLSVEMVCIVLTIEGSLECFHHCNIKNPKFMRYLDWLIQTPDQHLIHHQYKLHKYNYSPFVFWDYIFGTRKSIKTLNEMKLGFDNSKSQKSYVYLK